MEIGHVEFIQYCQTVSSELEERLQRMQTIVDHKLRSGTAYAEILRAFLDKHSAGKYEVSQGFIVNPFIKGASSNHCDILVYDQVQYPLLDVEGGIRVVLPRAAAMVIEVEPFLNETRLLRAFDNIRAARKVYPYISGIIFAVNGMEPDVLLQSMVEHADTWHAATAPVAVINMEKGFVAHRVQMTMELGGGKNPFDVYEFKGAGPSAALEFLFLLYFDLQMHGILSAGALPKACKFLMATGKANYLGQVKLGA